MDIVTQAIDWLKTTPVFGAIGAVLIIEVGWIIFKGIFHLKGDDDES